MVTKEQALTANEYHYTGNGPCKRTVGKRGGITVHIVSVRRNGQTKVWKRSPHRYCVPVKYGIYEYAYITENNAEHWHTAEDCPLHKETSDKGTSCVL